MVSRWIGLGLFIILVLGGRESGLAQKKGDITVQVVKYDGLKEAVLKNQGKVVVVDFWSTICIPCLKNMPHMVDLQHRLGKDGLVTITVSLDQVTENQNAKERLKNVLAVLREKKVDLVNFILDENEDLFGSKLRIKAIPSVYVFDRQGKWTQFISGEKTNVEPAQVEKLVVELLKEKASN